MGHFDTFNEVMDEVMETLEEMFEETGVE